MVDDVANAAVDALIEFLEAATYTVLRSRNVYSPQLFENKRLYSVTVSQCRHPGVRSYVGTVLRSIKPLLVKDTLQELVVAFNNQQGLLLSKVSFIIQGFNCFTKAVDWSKLESSFRSALLRLHFSDNLLRPLPPGSTFELLVVASSTAGVDPKVFAEEDIQSVTLHQPTNGLPLGSCNLPGALSMQVVLEEGPDTAAALQQGANTLSTSNPAPPPAAAAAEAPAQPAAAGGALQESACSPVDGSRPPLTQFPEQEQA